LEKQIYTKPQMPEKPTKKEIQATLDMLAALSTDEETNTHQDDENEPETKDLSQLLDGIVFDSEQ